MLRYKYDIMRFPMENESSYEVVVRAENGASPHAYEVYVFNGDPYAYTAEILYYFVDLSRYTKEELEEYLICWGYASLEKFQQSLQEAGEVGNYELRLATCITENDFFMSPESLMDGDFDDCFAFLAERLGRSPLDESES